MNKIQIVCSECGSTDVSKDATARWDEDRQEWVLSAVHDKPNFCEPCGGECSLDEVAIQ